MQDGDGFDVELGDPPTLELEDEPAPGTLRHALTRAVREGRQRAGLTVDELAAKVGCDRKTVSRVVNGHRWNVPMLERIMRALGIEREVCAALTRDDAPVDAADAP